MIAERRRRKSTNHEFRLRIRAVMELIATGHTKHEIIAFGKRTWAVTYGQVLEYIRHAREEIHDHVGRPKEELVADSWCYWMSVLKDPKSKRREKNEARRRADKLMGLQAPVTINLSVSTAERSRQAVESLKQRGLWDKMPEEYQRGLEEMAGRAAQPSAN